MKLTTTVTRDMLDAKGELVAVEATTLEVDSMFDEAEFVERLAKSGVFAEFFDKVS